MNISILENRLLFNVNTPAADGSVSENQDNNSQQRVSVPENELGNAEAVARRSQAQNQQGKPFFTGPLPGVSNMVDGTGKKIAAEVAASALFMPYGLYNVARFAGINPVINITRAAFSKAIWPATKFTAPRAVGSVGSMLYTGGVENIKRGWYFGAQTAQNLRRGVTGAAATAGLATYALPYAAGYAGLSALKYGVTKPLSWMTSPIPLIGSGVKAIDDGIDKTRTSLGLPLHFATSVIKADAKGAWENTKGGWHNFKGAALSIPETPLVGAARLVSEGAKDEVKGWFDRAQSDNTMLKAIFGKKDMGELRA